MYFSKCFLNFIRPLLLVAYPSVLAKHYIHSNSIIVRRPFTRLRKKTLRSRFSQY